MTFDEFFNFFFILPLRFFLLHEFILHVLHVLLQILCFLEGLFKIQLDIGVVLFFFFIILLGSRLAILHDRRAAGFAAMYTIIVMYFKKILNLFAGLKIDRLYIKTMCVGKLAWVRN